MVGVASRSCTQAGDGWRLDSKWNLIQYVKPARILQSLKTPPTCVHSDVYSLVKVPTHQGHCYCYWSPLFVDDFTPRQFTSWSEVWDLHSSSSKLGLRMSLGVKLGTLRDIRGEGHWPLSFTPTPSSFAPLCNTIQLRVIPNNVLLPLNAMLNAMQNASNSLDMYSPQGCREWWSEDGYKWLASGVMRRGASYSYLHTLMSISEDSTLDSYYLIYPSVAIPKGIPTHPRLIHMNTNNRLSDHFTTLRLLAGCTFCTSESACPPSISLSSSYPPVHLSSYTAHWHPCTAWTPLMQAVIHWQHSTFIPQLCTSGLGS